MASGRVAVNARKKKILNGMQLIARKSCVKTQNGIPKITNAARNIGKREIPKTKSTVLN